MIYGMLIAIGFALGGVGYLYRRLSTNRSIESLQLMESCGSGAFVGAGVHLIVCSLHPDQLVHHVAANGGVFVLPPGVHCEMDVLHRIHIAAAGVVTISLAMLALSKLYNSSREN